MNKLIFIPFCVFIISIRLNAQPSIDNNWNSTPYFFDNFNPPRSAWDNINWMDDPNELKWKAHLAGTVTCSSSNRMVFQKENAIFNSSDSTIRLRSEYAGGLLDTSDYTIPTGMTKDPSAGPLYYKSGAICVGKSGMQTFLYGYFEMRCKLPVNRGAFPAFWLWNSTLVNSVRNYREIDIFEFCWNITTRINDEGTPRYFEGQIYYYNGAEPTTLEDYKYGNHGYYVPINEPDLSNWHTYGMEWSPKHVKWYFDNKLLKSYMGDSMPSLSMYLIINNSVNNDADLEGGGESTDGFPNNMVIDYLKVNKLKCDCNSNASIQNNTQLAAFNHKVYESITIGGYGSDINIPSNTHTVFRATDEITINGNFELPLGSSMELITHPCPQ